ncbi:MAG: nucleotide sugar dehydrogenase [Candidatus Omnitrophica bacterium]|nr:nucleotide sugar dehydrogenase [Candidatus Omnitrophota bacterium]
MGRSTARLSPTAPLAQLTRRLAAKTAHVGVIGLGYVGLPLAVEFAKEGFPVTGIDLDGERVRQVNRGRSYVPDVSAQELGRLVRERRLVATTHAESLSGMDAIIICVPTPLRKTREPDISYIISAAQEIAKALRRGQVIVLESTTYPGTTDEVILPMLEAGGLKVGRDFCLAFSPERIDPGNATYTTRTIPKVIGGITPTCQKLAMQLYGQIIPRVVPVSSTKVAEMVKLLENTFRAVNIGLVNEIALMCDKLGVDVWEVIGAAKTKPFGFMAFYPGPGIGGHCLAEHERIVIKRGDDVHTPTFKELFRFLTSEGAHRIIRRRGLTVIRPRGLEALSFDLSTRQVCFQPLQVLISRSYEGPMVDLRTAEGRTLTVTDRHPMVVHNGALGVRWAKDLHGHHEPVVITSLPEGRASAQIDLIDHFRLDPRYVRPIRVVPQGFFWSDYRQWLRPILRRYRKDPWEYYRRNAIPLAAFLEAEALPSFPRINHRQLVLSTGKGPSWSTCPAVIPLDEPFCRLIGYYLSEGCVTEDQSLRVRFSFHQNEHAYIQDVQDILSRIGMRSSLYRSRQWQACHLKVSSLPFGVLIRDALRCGIDSYTMQVPPRLLGLSQRHRAALLAGLLRGDGGVEVSQGRRTYMKRGRRYTHWANHGSLNYYSVSPDLFHQTVLLLHGQGILPTFKRRANLLTVFGERHLRRCAEWLDGEKRQRLLTYLDGRRKPMSLKSFRNHDTYASVKLDKLAVRNGRHTVYSAEVANTHTFVTSYGIVVHNCIPSDPMYLAWKARSHGFEPRFIELADETNRYMPRHVVEKIAQALNERRKALKGSRVLLLGLAYKPDVNDTRDSPAFDVARELAERGGVVSYHDPYVPAARVNGAAMRSTPLTPQRLARTDCVVVLTNHSTVDYELIRRHAPLIVDTRNQYDRAARPGARITRL